VAIDEEFSLDGGAPDASSTLVPYSEMFPSTAPPAGVPAQTQMTIRIHDGRYELWTFPTADTRDKSTLQEIAHHVRKVFRDCESDVLELKWGELFPLFGRLAFLRTAPPAPERIKALSMQVTAQQAGRKLRRHQRRNRGQTTEWHVVAAVIAWHLRPFWKRHHQRFDLSDKGMMVEIIQQLLLRLGYRDAEANPITRAAIAKRLRRDGWKSDPLMLSA
jgi:hypothetical protein